MLLEVHIIEMHVTGVKIIYCCWVLDVVNCVFYCDSSYVSYNGSEFRKLVFRMITFFLKVLDLIGNRKTDFFDINILTSNTTQLQARILCLIDFRRLQGKNMDLMLIITNFT